MTVLCSDFFPKVHQYDIFDSDRKYPICGDLKMVSQFEQTPVCSAIRTSIDARVYIQGVFNSLPLKFLITPAISTWKTWCILFYDPIMPNLISKWRSMTLLNFDTKIIKLGWLHWSQHHQMHQKKRGYHMVPVGRK